MKSLIIIFVLVLLLTGCGNANNSVINNTVGKNTSDNISNNNYSENSTNTQVSRVSTEQKVEKEEELTTFSTPILIKESGRQKNISITCGKLNGKVVNKGETFSFTETVGKADPSQGYEKADTFDADGKVVQGYGGGNCQISSTLYNAVLNVPNLAIVERHEHSRDVTYVPERQRRCCCLWQCGF